MPVARFHCVHCGAPLKTSAELTPDKRIQCPKCETIFPVPSHLLGVSAKPGGTMQIGPDLTSAVGGESPRVQLVGMEDILGPESPQGPAGSPTPEAPARSPTPAVPRAEVSSEPWQEELGPAPEPQAPTEAEATQAWAGEIEEAGGQPAEQPTEIVGAPEVGGEGEAADTEVVSVESGDEVVTRQEPEVVDFGEELTEKKSSWWLWLILVVLLLIVGGVVLAWYMGWLDPVLEMLGLQSPKPSAQAPANENRQQKPQPASQAAPVSEQLGQTGTAGEAGLKPPFVKPLPPGGGGLLSTDVYAILEKVLAEAPARPIAEMHSWRYVPADANLVICLNFADLTQHPFVQQLLREGTKRLPIPAKPGQNSPQFPLDPADVAEMVMTFRVDWAGLSGEETGKTLVGMIRLHKPLDEATFKQIIETASTNVRVEKIGQHTVYYGTDMEGNRLFTCQVAPGLLVGGFEGREKVVPGLMASADAAIPKEWENLSRSAGNAQFAALVRDVEPTAVLKQLPPPPPEIKPYLPLLEKVRHGLVKLELTPKTTNLQVCAYLTDAGAAKQLASLVMQLYDEQVKPHLDQLAVFAPKLLKDVKSSLQMTAEDSKALVSLSASYPAIGEAAGNLLAMFGPAFMGKPGLPIKPSSKPLPPAKEP